MNKNIKYVFYVVGVLIVIIVVYFVLQANKTCVVTFDTHGGSIGGVIYASKNVKCGTKVEKPEDPILNGYKFVKWVIPGTDEEFDFNKYIEKDIKIDAKWEKSSS